MSKMTLYLRFKDHLSFVLSRISIIYSSFPRKLLKFAFPWKTFGNCLLPFLLFIIIIIINWIYSFHHFTSYNSHLEICLIFVGFPWDYGIFERIVYRINSYFKIMRVLESCGIEKSAFSIFSITLSRGGRRLCRGSAHSGVELEFNSRYAMRAVVRTSEWIRII